MTKKINFAIIGCGRISCKHANAIKEIPDANLVVVCDVIESKAKKLAAECGCDYTTDYNQVLARPDVDVINICTPSGNHAEITIAGAKAKKHVVTEKLNARKTV